MLFRFWGNSIEVNLVDAKAEFPILIKFAGRLTEVRPVR